MGVVFFGYIDESGVKFDQQVMAVALIILPSLHSHTKFQKQVLKAIFPMYEERLTQRQRRTQPLTIHFTELHSDSRLRAAELLAQKDIRFFASVHYHDGCATTYDEFFKLYKAMVLQVIGRALRDFEDLDLTIAKVSYDYEPELLGEIAIVRNELQQRLGFRKLKCKFSKASLAGLQLADYYAGAMREHLLPDEFGSKSGAFEKIRHQLIDQLIEASELSTI